MQLIVDDLQVDLKVGCDPEAFLRNTNGLISAHGMIPGNKETPHPVDDGAIQVDGMAVEFNINPANSIEEFVKNVNSVMKQLVQHLPEGCRLDLSPTAQFGKEYIDSQPMDAKELGCSPDNNAYLEGAENPKPNPEVPFRTAAGHVHIGWTDGMSTDNPEHMDTCVELIKILDLVLGVPSVLVDPDTQRRDLYGAAGAFRAKDYGVEYRTLSNFWLKSESHMKWVYRGVAKSVKMFLEGFRVSEEVSNKVVTTINTSNQRDASGLRDMYQLEVPNAK